MLTPDENSQISVLAAHGWSMTAIARHLGHDRKTICAHLQRDCAPAQRSSTRPDPFARFIPYVRARLAQHPDLPATTLYRELVARGFALSYPTLAARLRAGSPLRPPQPANPTTTTPDPRTDRATATPHRTAPQRHRQRRHPHRPKQLTPRGRPDAAGDPPQGNRTQQRLTVPSRASRTNLEEFHSAQS
jgi:hypothetical protein